MTFEKFSKIFSGLSYECEFRLYFQGKDREYMIIRFSDKVSFQRVGYYDGSGEVFYDSLDDLYKAVTVDNICLERDWDKLSDIIADDRYSLFDDKELAKFCEENDITL